MEFIPIRKKETMKKTENMILINDIMQTLDDLHTTDFYPEDELDSLFLQITDIVVNCEKEDLSALLDDLKADDYAEELTESERDLYDSVIDRLNGKIEE